MANYCGECMLWIGSQDINKYGEHWCPYSRRYESSNQNTYGCKGFVEMRRAILTKVCEVLNLPSDEYFRRFDEVKSQYLIPDHMEMLTAYNAVAPQLAEALERSDRSVEIAQELFSRFILPAKEHCDSHDYPQATAVYGEMVTWLTRELEG